MPKTTQHTFFIQNVRFPKKLRKSTNILASFERNIVTNNFKKIAKSGHTESGEQLQVIFLFHNFSLLRVLLHAQGKGEVDGAK